MTTIEFKKTLSNSFSKAANTYDSAAKLQREVAIALCNKLFHKMDAYTGTIIDLGSGTGTWSRVLAEKFPRGTIFSIDIAHGMIAYSLKNKSAANLFGICCDADNIPVQTSFTDLIFSNLMLQWSPNLDLTLKEIHRILKINGSLFISTLGHNSLKELRFCWQQLDDFPHINNFVTYEELIEKFKCLNLDNISIERMEYIFYYPTAIEIMRELKMIGANKLMLSRNKGLLTPGSLKKVLDFYENFRNQDHLLPVTYEIYLCMAQKSK
jgi:malonyl-CoA O-methyltransferase